MQHLSTKQKLTAKFVPGSPHAIRFHRHSCPNVGGGSLEAVEVICCCSEGVGHDFANFTERCLIGITDAGSGCLRVLGLLRLLREEVFLKAGGSLRLRCSL